VAMRETWSWERCKNKIMGLEGRLGFPKTAHLRFLKLNLSLGDGAIYDELRNFAYPREYRAWENIYCILSAYAKAEPTPTSEALKLVTSKQLQGGQYCIVAVERSKSSIRKVFGSNGKMLIESAKLLGGSEIDFSYGDHAVRVNSLPLVSVTVVLTEEDSEFPASTEILFNGSVSHYMTLEVVGMLTELTAERLKHANEVFRQTR
jgi:hypothetical protein